jgi:hypothetical protein
LNPGPPVPQTGALTGLRYAPPITVTSKLPPFGAQGRALMARNGRDAGAPVGAAAPLGPPPQGRTSASKRSYSGPHSKPQDGRIYPSSAIRPKSPADLGRNLELATSVKIPFRMTAAQANQEATGPKWTGSGATGARLRARMAELYVAQPNPTIRGQHRHGSTAARNNGCSLGLTITGRAVCASPAVLVKCLRHRRFVRGDYAGHQHQNRRHHLLARGLLPSLNSFAQAS